LEAGEGGSKRGRKVEGGGEEGGEKKEKEEL
jgi:hypothetical protein